MTKMNETLAVREAPAGYVLESKRVRQGYKQAEAGELDEKAVCRDFRHTAFDRMIKQLPKESSTP